MEEKILKTESDGFAFCHIPDNFFRWIAKQSSRKQYPVLLTGFLICLSLFFAFPGFDEYSNSTTSWDVTMLKSNDLTNSLSDINPDSWLAKKVFRLTCPAIIRVFHLHRSSVIIIQYLLGFLFIYFTYQLTNRIVGDSVSATLLATGVVFLYCGRCCFTDLIFTWFDGWAFFFLLMTLYNKNFLVVFLFATLAAWTDERAFIVLPVTILYHQLTTNNPRKFEWKELSTITASSIAVIAAMTGYMALRLFLTYAYDMHTPSESQFVAVLEDNIATNRFTFGMFTFFEGFWLLFPIMIVLAVKNKHYLFLTAVTLQVVVSSIVAISVFDITRSGSYLIPLLFVLIFYISNFINTKQLRLLLLTCVFFSFIFPPINYITTWKMEEMLEQPFLKHLLNQSF